MKILLTLILTTGSLLSFAQVDSNENMVLQLVKDAVDSKKLPTEVVNLKDSTKYPHNVVVIHRTKENGLRHGVSLKREDIDYRIWTGEELFLNAVYWLEPSALKVDTNKAAFNFVTRHGGAKGSQCYAGKLKGEHKNGKWTLVSSSYKRTKCDFNIAMYE